MRSILRFATPILAVVSLCCLSGCVVNRKIQMSVPMTPTIDSKRAAFWSGNPHAFMPVEVVEVDNMGELWDRCPLDAPPTVPCQLRDTLRDIRARRLQAQTDSIPGRPAIEVTVVTYVHGWQHNAKTNDDNAASFSMKLWDLQAQADAASASAPQQVARKVYVGVYVAWRGETYSGPLNFFTVVEREHGAERAAQTSMQEVLVRIRSAAKSTADDREGTNRSSEEWPTRPARFFLMGHSYGARIVQRTMAKILATQLIAGPESRLVPCPNGVGRGVAPFADLTVIVNPAVNALETEEMIDLMKRSSGIICPSLATTSTMKPPMLIDIHSRSDGWTGKLPKIIWGTRDINKATRPKGELCAWCSDGAGLKPSQAQINRNPAAQWVYFQNLCYIDAATISSTQVRVPGDSIICDNLQRKVRPAFVQTASGVFLPQKRDLGTQVHSPTIAVATTDDTKRYWAFPTLAESSPVTDPMRKLFVRVDPANCGASNAATCTGAQKASWNNTPYWILTVPDETVDGHSHFWRPDFFNLVQALAKAAGSEL